MRKTKILYALNGVFHKGGTEAVVLNYFRNIDKDKYHIDFLLHGDETKKENRENETHQYLIASGSTLHYVTPRGVSFTQNKKDIRRVLSQYSYDIVHSHMDAAGYFFLKEAKRAGITARFAHSHNTSHQINKGNPIKNMLYRVILDYSRYQIRRAATTYVACSSEAGRWLFGKQKMQDIIILKNAIDLQSYLFNATSREEKRAELKLEGKTVLGHVGRFSYQKNHRYLLEIFEQITKKEKSAVLMLIGDGELFDEVQQLACVKGIKDSILFLGLQDNVAGYLQAMDIFVLPSHFEGLPVVAVEAQASGLPCVISNNVSPEVQISNNVALLPIQVSPSIWADSILNTLSQFKRTNMYSVMTDAGYNISSVVDELEELYEISLFDKRIRA